MTNTTFCSCVDALTSAPSVHGRLASNMTRPSSVADSLPAPEPREAARSPSTPRLWDDWVLQIAFLVVGLLLAYQLIVTLLQPAWIGPATDWLLALVAWPGLLGVVLLSLWLTRTGQPGA